MKTYKRRTSAGQPKFLRLTFQETDKCYKTMCDLRDGFDSDAVKEILNDVVSSFLTEYNKAHPV